MRHMNQDPLYMENVIVPDFANNLQARIKLREMKAGYRALAELYIDLARPLADPKEKMNLGLQRATELQTKLLEEDAAMGRVKTFFINSKPTSSSYQIAYRPSPSIFTYAHNHQSEIRRWHGVQPFSTTG